MLGAAGAHENVPGHPVQVHPHVSPAQAAFDKLLWDIDDGVYPIGSRVDALKLLAWLRGAVPAGDVHRELQYRYMHCLLGFQHVAEGALDYAREGVAAALSDLPGRSHPPLAPRWEIELEFSTPRDAYRGSFFPGVDYPEPRRLRFVRDEWFEVLRTLRFLW